jgi:small subunit ribosomal protein S16
MIAIKLQRIGRRHQPSYRLVVAEKRSKLGGEPIEDLGAFHPSSKAFTVKAERVQYWLGVGAQPTTTAHNLLVKNGVIQAPTRAVRMPKPVPKEAPAVEAPAAAPEAAQEGSPAEAPAAEAAAAETETAEPAA